MASAPPVVLVVEDEPILRMAAVEMVKDSGLTALEVPDAETALAVLKTRPDIRLVFTDVKMPGRIDGMRLAGLVHDRWPLIDVIVTSGELAPGEVPLPAGGVFIPKPYDHGKLVHLMHRLVD
ncbi:response regulator [Novosphingobium terrae]|uniref:response regulator n=1 Tax=Novosphingobium terrae TaxID=2726189 RepID=UPI00198189DC|nr:response regulator [Novosphingobium terrae]